MQVGVSTPVGAAVPGGTDIGVIAGGSVASRTAVADGVEVGGMGVAVSVGIGGTGVEVGVEVGGTGLGVPVGAVVPVGVAAAGA